MWLMQEHPWPPQFGDFSPDRGAALIVEYTYSYQKHKNDRGDA
jgi:hypothetical protein